MLLGYRYSSTAHQFSQLSAGSIIYLRYRRLSTVFQCKNFKLESVLVDGSGSSMKQGTGSSVEKDLEPDAKRKKSEAKKKSVKQNQSLNHEIQ